MQARLGDVYQPYVRGVTDLHARLGGRELVLQPRGLRGVLLRCRHRLSRGPLRRRARRVSQMLALLRRLTDTLARGDGGCRLGGRLGRLRLRLRRLLVQPLLSTGGAAESWSRAKLALISRLQVELSDHLVTHTASLGTLQVAPAGSPNQEWEC